MPGPRIYTEAWERLKVAAKETEFREIAGEAQPATSAPEKPKRRRAPRVSIISIAVLAVLAILTASLWIDSQTRLMTVAGDLTDFKTRLGLLQEKVKKMEDEKQRLEEENGTLSAQYEKRVAELARLEDELDVLRAQKEKSKPKQKQAASAVEKPSAIAPGAPRAARESPLPPPEEKVSASRLQKQEQQDVKVYKID
jgi:septal ring factor EnvC (AmiA/AmiB activator)